MENYIATNSNEKKKKIVIVQQGAWDMSCEQMPLAAGYIKSYCLNIEKINKNASIIIINFKGGVEPIEMANSLFSVDIPDILAFSVLGWNIKKFSSVSSLYKQLNPEGIIVFGGPHVANQAHRIFKTIPDVDIIANGEGEIVFSKILLNLIANKDLAEYSNIEGISIRLKDDLIITTPCPATLIELDSIPSPFLNGTIELFDENNNFKYDVALMETSRGCPYSCSYCNWGGMTGKKIRRFSKDRLWQEIELFAKKEITNLVLCDSNFGHSVEDEEFVDLLIKAKNKYGYPKNFETSWAKNKSDSFMRIIKKLKRADLSTSLTVAFQSLNKDALTNMNRTNMDINDCLKYINWLTENDFECYGELIWGVPGETYDSFLDGYNFLSKYIDKIAIYPLLLIPNTEFYEKSSDYKLISIQNQNNDFLLVYSNETISIDDNYKMYSFIFWARLLVENLIFNVIWLPLRTLTDLKKTDIIFSFIEYIKTTNNPELNELKSYNEYCIKNFDPSFVSKPLKYIYSHLETLDILFTNWWHSYIIPVIDAEYQYFFIKLFEYDILIKPLYSQDNSYYSRSQKVLKPYIKNNEFLINENIELNFDFPEILNDLKKGLKPKIQGKNYIVDIIYKKGFHNFVFNQEFIKQFTGTVINKKLLK